MSDQVAHPIANSSDAAGTSLLARLRRHQEPLWWAAAFAIVIYMQWPMLRGYYFKLSGSVAPASPIAWTTDLQAALAESKRTGKPVLLDAEASWCPPCIAMKHDVWPDGEIARLVADRVIPLRIDVDAQPAVATRYNVDTIPTILLLDSDGSVLRTAGYLPRSGMVRFLTDARWSD